jgi:uncharacterized membrane protein
MPRRKAVKKKIVKRTRTPAPRMEIFRAKLNRRKSSAEQFADFLTNSFGTVWFLNANMLAFLAWIVLNVGIIPGVKPFDPYPFGLLTMAVSLEAIGLSIVVLISQNRQEKIADAREEIDYQVDVQAEKQIAAMMRMLEQIRHHLHITHLPDENTSSSAVDVDELEARVMNEIE